MNKKLLTYVGVAVYSRISTLLTTSLLQDEVALSASVTSDAPLDLSGPEPSKRSQTPPASPSPGAGLPGPILHGATVLPATTHTTHVMLKELLSLYGLNEVAEGFLKHSMQNQNTSSAFAPGTYQCIKAL